ncbi:MAG TPA: hypothetical protein VN944_05445 [Nitrospiria bacterium]|nr:hypothetical protein [Nitrospiria bacterium]
MNLAANQNQAGTRRFLLLLSPVVLFVFFYFFLSCSSLIHVYSHNEILDDGGCSIGSLFCHGQTEGSSPLLINNPLHFRYLVFLSLVFSIPFIPFDLPLQRGPPPVLR